jgi:hypothetical protein
MFVLCCLTVTHVPGVGEMMLASFVSSTNTSSATDNWWIGEKYDGIRACWNPVTNTLVLFVHACVWLVYGIHVPYRYNRSGLVLELFEEFKGLLSPTSFLDGELWIGRSSFKLLVSAKQQDFFLYQDRATYYKLISIVKYLIFDIPSFPPLHLPNKLRFEDRYARVMEHAGTKHPFVSLVCRHMCPDRKCITTVINA